MSSSGSSTGFAGFSGAAVSAAGAASAACAVTGSTPIKQQHARANPRFTSILCRQSRPQITPQNARGFFAHAGRFRPWTAAVPRALAAGTPGTLVAQRNSMKATTLLIQQHHEVARLFKAIEAAKSADDKRKLFKELAGNLAGHDGIERQVLYPACKETMGLSDELGEALVEHGVIEFALYQANEAVGKPDFDFKCKVLKELVEHHVKEEEGEFFPKVEKAFSPDTLEALGDEMQEAFEDAMS